MPLRESRARVARGSPTMGISTSKSNIRELIRLKTMGHKSANDRITRRNKDPSALARRGTQPEILRKLISFRGFIIWISYHLLAVKRVFCVM